MSLPIFLKKYPPSHSVALITAVLTRKTKIHKKVYVLKPLLSTQLSITGFTGEFMVPFFISASPKSGVSPQPSKLAKPLQTLVEEQHIREAKPLLDQDEDVSVCVLST